MEASALTKIAPPIILGLMMLGMGLSMVKDDFHRVLQYPKAIGVGMLGQLLVLPLIAFVLCSLLPTSPEICVGIMIVAACPGGPGCRIGATEDVPPRSQQALGRLLQRCFLHRFG